MNRNQLEYQIGRAVYNNYDIMFLAVATKFGYDSIENFINSQGFSDLRQVVYGAFGTFWGILALYYGSHALYGGNARRLLYSELGEIRAESRKYPLEHSERIIIDDTAGLDNLLEKTRERGSIEWGTLLKAHDDQGRAVVYDILDIALGKRMNLIGEGTLTSMDLKIIRANEEGYKGYHHYHPLFGAINFSVGLNDRFKPKDWINLLTFNLPEGPEIVGFNRQHTYIPADATKRELVRATPGLIMEYLNKRAE